MPLSQNPKSQLFRSRTRAGKWLVAALRCSRRGEGKGPVVAPDGQGRVLPLGEVVSPQTRRTPMPTHSEPHSPPCSGFCSGFERGTSHFPTDVTQPIQAVDYPKSTGFTEVLKGNPCREVVREERVELSTFGSGGRRSIQLSYSRRLAPRYAKARPTATSFWRSPFLAPTSSDSL